MLFLATLSTVVVPLPEEATLLGAGYAARLGKATLAGCIAAPWLAVMIGDVTSYCVGRFFLARMLRTRWGQRFVPEERRRWAETLVARNGARAVVLARFLVGLRGFVYFAVGAAHYPFPRFLAVNAAAGVVEVGALVSIGFALGELRTRVGQAVDVAVAVVVVLTMVAPFFARRFARRR